MNYGGNAHLGMYTFPYDNMVFKFITFEHYVVVHGEVVSTYVSFPFLLNNFPEIFPGLHIIIFEHASLKNSLGLFP